jgi:allantoinase
MFGGHCEARGCAALWLVISCVFRKRKYRGSPAGPSAVANEVVRCGIDRFLPVLCQDAGLKYVMDWYSDDQPFYLTGKGGGKLLNIPCSQDLGDMPAILAHDATPAAYADMLIDAFEEMRHQAKKHPQQLVFSVPLRAWRLIVFFTLVVSMSKVFEHFPDTFIAGQPLRLPHIRRVFEHIAAAASAPDSDVWLALPRDIAEAFVASNSTETIPASP